MKNLRVIVIQIEVRVEYSVIKSFTPESDWSFEKKKIKWSIGRE